MVKIDFKLYEVDVVELDIDQPQKLNKVIQKAAEMADLEVGGFIVVRGGKVISLDEIVGKNDEISVFPAISGG